MVRSESWDIRRYHYALQSPFHDSLLTLTPFSQNLLFSSIPSVRPLFRSGSPSYQIHSAFDWLNNPCTSQTPRLFQTGNFSPRQLANSLQQHWEVEKSIQAMQPIMTGPSSIPETWLPSLVCAPDLHLSGTFPQSSRMNLVSQPQSQTSRGHLLRFSLHPFTSRQLLESHHAAPNRHNAQIASRHLRHFKPHKSSPVTQVPTA